METFVANSWLELQELIYKDSFSKGLNRFRSSFTYRGLESKDYELSTSLNRLGDTRFEHHLLRNFKKYSQIEDDGNKSVWNWLALGQHYGLPTRLLDWTYSPLVALHFATADFNKFDEDGVIWAINYLHANQHLPKKLKEIIAEEGSYIFTEKMLRLSELRLEQLKELQRKDFALFFEPPSIDQRIVSQYAVFSMMSDPNVLIDQWIIDTQIDSFKIIIPAHLKWEIRDKLDQSNINERVLFPGLDGLTQWLKRHYKDISK